MNKTKNFYIGESVFEDMHDLMQDVRNAHRNESTDSEEFEDIQKALYQSVKSTMTKYDDESKEEFDDRAYEEMNDVIRFNKISKDGIFYSALLAWFRARDESMNKKIRNFYEDGDSIYFITGVGYDTISSDLLGGEADGKLKDEFLEFLNN